VPRPISPPTKSVPEKLSDIARRRLLIVPSDARVQPALADERAVSLGAQEFPGRAWQRNSSRAKKILARQNARDPEPAGTRRPPTRFIVSATVTGECVREHLDKKRQSETFVAEIHAAQRQDRSSLLAVKNTRVVGRTSIAVDQPRPRQPFTVRCDPIASPVGSRRRADVDQNRVAVSRNAGGERIRTEARATPP